MTKKSVNEFPETLFVVSEQDEVGYPRYFIASEVESDVDISTGTSRSIATYVLKNVRICEKKTTLVEVSKPKKRAQF